MTFIIILISLIIERFFDWSHLRRWQWFTKFQAGVSGFLSNGSPFIVLSVSILLPTILIGLLNYLLLGLFFGSFTFLLGIIVLMYCLGPTNFWAESYAAIKTLKQSEQPKVDLQYVQKFFVEANRRVFAVMFWFVLLGPMGAVLYRLMDLSKDKNPAALEGQRLLDWLPVRLFTFMFALAGHFTEVVKYWKDHLHKKPDSNEVVLMDCGMAALDIMKGQPLSGDGELEKETLALLDRAFILSLMLLAIIVLVV